MLYAELKYGKIYSLYESEMTIEQLAAVFDPSTVWVDVTGQNVEVGYVYKNGIFSPPEENDNSKIDLEDSEFRKIDSKMFELFNDIKDIKEKLYSDYNNTFPANFIVTGLLDKKLELKTILNSYPKNKDDIEIELNNRGYRIENNKIVSIKAAGDE